MENLKNVNTAEFDDVVLNTPGLVLVDFWADWCGPCKALAPMLKDVAADFADELVIAKVDIVAEPDLAERYGISSIPALKFFKNGAEVENMIGVQSRGKLTSVVEGLL